MRVTYVETMTFKDIQTHKIPPYLVSVKLMDVYGRVSPLTFFVLDDVLVLLVHDGATEAVLGPGKES